MQLLVNHGVVSFLAAAVLSALLHMLNLKDFIRKIEHEFKILANYLISRQTNGFRPDVNTNNRPRPV